jgi:Asp-tRNA(Asn)/Glu-tRNA(Gln) amidotransferase C subunit
VSVIDTIAADTTGTQLTPRYNVFRADVITNESGSMSEAILAQAPKRSGHFFEVKKILNTDD